MISTRQKPIKEKGDKIKKMLLSENINKADRPQQV